MRKYSILIIFTSFLISSSSAQINSNEEIDDLLQFLVGSYDIIGRLPDSRRTYTGKSIFKLEDNKNKLKVLRIIEDKEIEGTGTIECVSEDKIKVLKVKFTEYNYQYEVTYIINSDLNNYARLTGNLYFLDKDTTQPGLEALFIDNTIIE